MKNCEEMVSSLLRRRAEYEAKQRSRRRTVLRISTVACSLALVLVISTGVGQGWWVMQAPELPTLEPTLEGTEPTATQIQEPTCTEEPEEIVLEPDVVENQIIIDGIDGISGDRMDVCLTMAEKIIINEIDGISSDRMYICLLCDDFVPMTDAELNDYFGRDIFPKVPEDLGEEWCVREGTQKGIYRRDGGTGEVYHDQQVLNWSNEDFTRTLNIELQKGSMPFSCCLFLSDEYERSLICGVEVGIGQTDNGIYLAEFLYQNVGFRVIAEGLSLEELVAVIGSLIL